MGIEWIGSYCNGSTAQPHYLVEVDKLGGQSIMLCKYCYKPKVLPNSLEAAQTFTVLAHKYGLPDAYYEYLSYHPEARWALANLLNIWNTNKSVLAYMLKQDGSYLYRQRVDRR